MLGIAPYRTLLLVLGLAAGTVANAQEPLVVTATRLPEPAASLPQSETIVSGQDLRDRGAFDLRAALATVAGVEVLPGGDAGPAGATLALHGLAEMDAYLLVVDGVPYGGAFNPATATLDFIDLDRIELLRGAAPVSFGATSFVGVVHLLHAPAGEQATRAWSELGTPGRDRLAFTTTLSSGEVGQSLLASAETRGDAQDRADFSRVHFLYRAATDVGGGRLHLDLDGTSLDQQPQSPQPLEDIVPTPRFPRYSNVNPSDGRQDQRRVQTTAGFDRSFATLLWSTTASVARTRSHVVRGFLRNDFATDGVTVNADGYRQSVTAADGYLDSHVGHKAARLDWIVGADWLFGYGRQTSANFEYPVLPDGSNAPRSTSRTTDESTLLRDRRSFAGLYAQAVARPTPALTVLAGLRVNRTDERRCGSEGEGVSLGEDVECTHRRNTRLSGSAGASLVAWRGIGAAITAFANYRDTYKPAAIDFGPEAEPDILRPETAHGWEAGLRASASGGRITAEASLFDTRFNNLVIAENVAGLPALANAGSERLRGIEIEGRWSPRPDFNMAATYAHHIARFAAYAIENEDGSLDQLAGHRLALSPQDIGSVIATLAPERGPQLSATMRFVGSRFLNKENSVGARAYTSFDARAGWRFGRGWGLFVAAENFTDRSDPIAESELGDTQFFRLPGRSVWISAERSF